MEESPLDIIANLINTYPHMTQKISELLKNNVINEVERLENNRLMIQKLSQQSEEFCENFINKNRYYYCSKNDLYMHFDGKHFVPYNESDIIYNILHDIKSYNSLSRWKHKVKINTLKHIKLKSPIFDQPENILGTISNYIYNEIVGKLFPCENSAKYFMLCIGHNIITKNKNDFIYIIDRKYKNFINEIESLYYTYFGKSNIFINFKYKYYNHDYNCARFIKTINSNEKNIKLPKNISEHIIDFFALCYKLQTIYGTPDDFIMSLDDSTPLYKHVFFVNNKSPEKIVDIFIEKMIEESILSEISFNRMIILWKIFLNNHGVPNIIFQNKLIDILKNKFEYCNSSQVFKNITSSYLPNISTFLTYIDEKLSKNTESDDLYIGDLLQGFDITMDTAVDLLNHVYNDIEIDNYYILNYCKN